MNYKNITALIADDEAHMRTFLKLLLKDIGIEKVYLMQNGMDAVEAFQEYEPDLILLDINMNKMNGIDALKIIKEIKAEAKVIMMTAVSTRSTIEESARNGATYYILKTQSPEEIKEQINKVLSSFAPIAS